MIRFNDGYNKFEPVTENPALEFTTVEQTSEAPSSYSGNFEMFGPQYGSGTMPLFSVGKSSQTPQEMVKEFHTVFKSEEIPPKKVGLSHSPLEELRLKKLITEEYEELMDAYENDDFIEVVDALADLVYVIYGAALTIGVDLDDCLREVHRTNMNKLDENGEPILDENGKIRKPAGWQGPDLRKVIYGQ